MIRHRCFPPEPWAVRETELDISVLAQTESIFALSNGHIGLRANLEEGEPHGLPGTYLNSFYETHPLPYAEPGYGYPEAGQTLANVTNGKIIRLLVDDAPFDVRYGRLRAHERILDLRAGTLQRRAEWVSPAGQAVRVSSVRLVSFAQRAIAAILYEVEPLDTPARLVVQSELVTNEPLPATVQGDPRAGSGAGSALRSEYLSDHDARVVLVHSTKESGLRMAAGMDHVVEGPPGTQITVESSEDLGRATVATELEPGQRLRLVKFLGYGWSSQRSLPSVRDQVEAALAPRRSCIWGSATFVIVPSMKAIAEPMIVAASTHGAEAGIQGAEARLVRTTPSSHGGLPMLATNHPASASPLPSPAVASEAPQCPIPRSSPRPDTRSP